MIDGEEAGALRVAARNRFPELDIQTIGQTLPAQAMALLRPLDGVVQPVWFQQASWGAGRWSARWGHRFLGLHRILQEGERYSTFTETVKPTLVDWLEAARQAYTFLGTPPVASTVAFAYVNQFAFGPDEADLSSWFRLNYGVQADGADDGLTGVTCTFRIDRPEERSRATISVAADSDGDGGIGAHVHTLVERDLPEGSTLADAERLLDEIAQAKITAKRLFFSFVTDQTLQRMGATGADA